MTMANTGLSQETTSPAGNLPPPRPGDGGRKRVQFEFAPDSFERLQRIKDTTGAPTYADVIRNAMRLYEWFITQQHAGYEIGLIKEDKLEKRVEFYF